MISITGLAVLAGVWAAQAEGAEALSATPLDHLELLALLDEGEAALAAADDAALRRVLDQWEPLGVLGFDGEPSAIMQEWAAAAPAGEDAPPVRGAVRGPGVHRGALEPGAQIALTRAYYAGRVAPITMGAPRGSVLALQIQEREGPTVCEHVSQDHPVTCQWTPIWTSDYVIEVRNLADGPARYRLVSN